MGNQVIHKDKEFNITLDEFPDQRELAMDWSDENFVYDITEMNCVLNCALGKLAEKHLPPTNRSEKYRSTNKAIKFADTLEDGYS